jgi:hypothetical protein
MTEKGGIDAKPTEERMVLIFQLLDDMVPHMGIFRQTVSLMKKEIYGNHFFASLEDDMQSHSQMFVPLAPQTSGNG